MDVQGVVDLNAHGTILIQSTWWPTFTGRSILLVCRPFQMPLVSQPNNTCKPPRDNWTAKSKYTGCLACCLAGIRCLLLVYRASSGG